MLQKFDRYTYVTCFDEYNEYKFIRSRVTEKKKMASPAVGLAATTNLVGEDRFIIPNKAALLAISSDRDEPAAIICAYLASVVQ